MIDPSLIAALKRDEGFDKFVYLDSEGFQTIGTGHLVDRRLGGGIPKAVDDFWLDYDIKYVQAELNQRVPWWRTMSRNRQNALINMGYNLGLPRLMKFEKMLSALKEKRYKDAKVEALDSLWAKQVGARAIRIADIFERG